MAKLIKTDGTTEQARPDQPGGKFSLQRMQRLVGGSVQVVRLNAAERMIVDEDGRPKDKPVNEEASRILQSYSTQPTVPLLGDVLLGDKKEFRLG